MRVLVTEALSERGLEVLREDFEVDVREDLATGDLTSAVGPYDALVVRSQTKVSAGVIDAAENLKVVARAGIGIDNVDVDAATRKGVVVLNAPQSNIVSAAEHTIALLLSQARHIPAANAVMKSGSWERERFQGVELQGKTLGLVGMGRVGTMVAQRCAAFGMRLIAFDPYVSRDKAREMGVELMPTLEALLVQADFVSIHLPKTPETEDFIGERELTLMKEGARLVNTSRGGIVDEDALTKALKDGHLAGAALDVFATEPALKSPLFEFDEVVVTPHLGASTVEAQDKAGVTIAQMVRLALRGEFVPYAVNLAAGAEIPEVVRPFMPLAEKLGGLLTGLAEGALQTIECQYLGRLAEVDTRVLTLAAVKGTLAGVVHEPLSYVNAPVIAQERGIAVHETKTSVSRDYVNLISLRATTEDGDVSVAGTLVGKRGGDRIVRVLDFDVDMQPAHFMAFFLYEDRPGVIGKVGDALGTAGINVASMEVGRRSQGGLAVMGLTVDDPIPDEVFSDMVREIGAEHAHFIVLPE
ncbi:MAG: phosphoglycerate dehydrogenase [Actinomycetota bacterium]